MKNVEYSEEKTFNFDYEWVLQKYGPEGCYAIARNLIAYANRDVEEALKQAGQEEI